ncbi:hypothetical protein HPB51_027382 [Rhipicephalus microplus]|uniref:Uncharacterized protein n=1 Tax=Rhipicephalus microplus TaxID=6941 RepID=A0A9J6D0D1_RHIMP|nr:hypothetical protein HPB51_027382 [Rhipicephalus microplus]
MSGCLYSDWCEVYLCSRPLQQGSSINGAVNAFSLLTSSSQSASGNSWAMHWLLVFDCGEDEVLICDADNHEGDLTGRTYWKKRAALENYGKKVIADCSLKNNDADTDVKLVQLRYRVVYSSSALRVFKEISREAENSERTHDQLLRKMCDSASTITPRNNCQKWARDLLHELDIEMPSDEVDAHTVVTNYIQPAAIAGAVVLGAGLLGALIFSSGARRNRRD